MNMYSLEFYSIIVWVLVKHTELKLPIFIGDFVRALEVGLIVRSSQAQLSEMGKLVKGCRSMRLKECSISASLHFLIVLIWLYKTGKWERWEFEHARKVLLHSAGSMENRCQSILFSHCPTLFGTCSD